MGTLESFNPATGELVGSVETIDPGRGPGGGRRRRRGAAVLGAALARRPRPATCAGPPRSWSADIEEVADLLTREQGKPITESYTMELIPTIDALRWIAEAGPEILADEQIR